MAEFWHDGVARSAAAWAASPLVGADRRLAGFGSPEEPDEAYADEADERGPAEDVDEGPQQSLLAKLLVERGCGGVPGVGLRGVLAHVSGQGAHLLLKPRLGATDIVRDLRLVEIGAAHQFGLGDGDTDRSADIPDQVEDAAGVADLVVAQGAVRLCGDGDEDEAEGKPGQDDGNQQGPGADAEVEIAEDQGGNAESDEAEGEE